MDELEQNDPKPMVGLFYLLTDEQKERTLNVTENIDFGLNEFRIDKSKGRTKTI